MAENFIDVYHFRTLHAGTFGNQKNPATNLPYDEDQIVIYRPGGKSLTPTGEMLLGRLPWLTADDPSAAGHMPPNAYFTCHGDNVQVWMSWPLSPSRSRIMIYTIFAEEQFARDDFEEHACGLSRLRRPRRQRGYRHGDGASENRRVAELRTGTNYESGGRRPCHGQPPVGSHFR